MIARNLEKETGKGKYRYRIGCRALLGNNKGTNLFPGERHFLNAANLNHRCLLLNNDIFEYGDKGWKRHVNIGMDRDYDWKRIPVDAISYGDKDVLFGLLIGRTDISPNELEEIIDENGEWTSENYNLYFHNCHNFVDWCIKQIR